MLFVGDDWAEDHHDVEIQEETGRRLARARLPEGVAGIARLHALLAEHLPSDAEPAQVVVGIETDRGPWVGALVAAGYQVFAVNPMQVARYRERHSTSGAKSDTGDARTLADLVRTDRHRHRLVAGDSDTAEAVKILARVHQTLIWDRQRQVLRLRAALREFFPAAINAFDELHAGEALELLGRAPDPTRAARLSRSQITGALRRAGRRSVDQRAEAIQQILRAEQLPQPAAVQAAYAATVTAAVTLIAALNSQIHALEGEVSESFHQHPDAEIYLSQPGLGTVLAARVLAEFGDDPDRYRDARSRKNYAGNSPITRQSGKKLVVLARYARNTRLADALHQQAFCALTASPGARAYYDELRARGAGHHAALRQVANRLTGILHGCLKTSTRYNETTAWAHRTQPAAA
ncbi:IS110 family transposase [Micromonospora sp. ATA51]|uniref:IS110 family transposase n=1 Tax=Micromonospora sp. ATA51 TaxID=2806098 RepID=UPI001A5FDFC9|nr:IS110 family transposase [Micromonospora sp. ATA51]MBM0229196.1 IS110 family transposase [Micromonospora sp. ATA51]